MSIRNQVDVSLLIIPWNGSLEIDKTKRKTTVGVLVAAIYDRAVPLSRDPRPESISYRSGSHRIVASRSRCNMVAAHITDGRS